MCCRGLWKLDARIENLNMECRICTDEDCEPDCPVAQWKRGMDAGTILRYNWQNGGHAIIIAEPPYTAHRLGHGKCKLHSTRVGLGCEGESELYSWNGQDPYTLEHKTMKICSTCFFQLELVRNNIESMDGY